VDVVNVNGNLTSSNTSDGAGNLAYKFEAGESLSTVNVTGTATFAFNSQVQYVSLYVPPEVHAMNAEALKGLDAGKSCIRFRKPETIDFELLDKLLRDTAARSLKPS